MDAAKSLVANETQALVGLLFAACVLSATVNMLILDRIFSKVYFLNIKYAFKSKIAAAQRDGR